MYPYELFWGVHLYGVMISVGILACFAVLYLYTKVWKIKENFVDFIFFTAIVAIIVGFFSAALFQATYNYIENPEAGFNLGGGITFIGGLIGGILSFLAVYFLFRKKYDTRLYQMVSIAPCCILIAHAFGRIGCFFAGCCYGKPTDSIFGVTFVGHSVPVHPTQLYEAIFLFLLFGVCSYLALKKKYQHNLTIYLVAYGIFRFFLEFLRGDDRGQLLGFISPSQFWSILMVVAGVIVYFYHRKLLRKAAAEAEKAKEATDEEVAAEQAQKTE